MVSREHEARAETETPPSLRCGVITASDSRTPETDTSGALIRDRLTATGHEITRYAVERDEAAKIADLVRAFTAAGCQVIIINGGTGIAKRDSTFEAAAHGNRTSTLPRFPRSARRSNAAWMSPAS